MLKVKVFLPENVLFTSSSSNEYVRRFTDNNNIKHIIEKAEANSVLKEIYSDWTNVKYHN